MTDQTHISIELRLRPETTFVFVSFTVGVLVMCSHGLFHDTRLILTAFLDTLISPFTRDMVYAPCALCLHFDRALLSENAQSTHRNCRSQHLSAVCRASCGILGIFTACRLSQHLYYLRYYNFTHRNTKQWHGISAAVSWLVLVLPLVLTVLLLLVDN